jgi:sugar phosphate isomerase/epimerase
MKPFKIGAFCESFRLPLRDGMRKAKELGIDGVQLTLAPAEHDARARRELKAFCKQLGIEISALCHGIPGHGLQIASENAAKVKMIQDVAQLAADLDVTVMTTHIGVIPEDRRSDTYHTMVAACREIGEFSRRVGVTLAIETGPETAEVLKGFLDETGSAGVGVNMDPANLVMVTRDDPVKAVRTLGRTIVHTHAKDGINLQPCSAAEVYGAFASGGFAALEKRMGRIFQEVPLGQGQVKWDAYLEALEDTGFKGFLTIEREIGADPVKDINDAVQFLSKKTGTGMVEGFPPGTHTA